MRSAGSWLLLAAVALAWSGAAHAQSPTRTPSCPPGHVWSVGPPAACVCNAGGNITCGLGLCQVTVPACVGNSTVASQCIPNDPPTPNQDVCNGKDDDCDGLIDEDDANTWVTCGHGVCQNRVKPCVGGEWVGTAWCYPRLEQATNETCDGIDNDCDGIVDNVASIGYKTCGKGKCARTIPWCFNGTEAECVPGAPRDEVCNNLDDDCDGLIDEDLGHTLCGNGCVVPKCFQGNAVTCDNYPSVYPDCRVPRIVSAYWSRAGDVDLYFSRASVPDVTYCSICGLPTGTSGNGENTAFFSTRPQGPESYTFTENAPTGTYHFCATAYSDDPAFDFNFPVSTADPLEVTVTVQGFTASGGISQQVTKVLTEAGVDCEFCSPTCAAYVLSVQM